MIDSIYHDRSIKVTDEDVGNFAKKVYENYEIGFEECDNGVLLFVAVEDQKLTIIGGKGTEDKLNDDMKKEILIGVTKHLANRNYDEAIYFGVSQIIQMVIRNPDLDGLEPYNPWDF